MANFTRLWELLDSYEAIPQQADESDLIEKRWDIFNPSGNPLLNSEKTASCSLLESIFNARW